MASLQTPYGTFIFKSVSSVHLTEVICNVSFVTHTDLVKYARSRSSMHFKRNVVHCIIVCFSDRVLAGESLHQDIESFGHKSGCWNLVCVFSLEFLLSV